MAVTHRTVAAGNQVSIAALVNHRCGNVAPQFGRVRFLLIALSQSTHCHVHGPLDVLLSPEGGA